MATMASPAPPLLTSLANPRVKAAVALRDRRERDRTGLTLIDGARELRRALDAGVEVVEAFVCEPLLAGPDARAALDRLDGRPGAGDRRRARRSSPGWRSASGPRAWSPSSGSRRPTSRTSRCRPTRWSWSSRASRSRATSGPSCAAPTGPAPTPSIAASPRTDLFNPNAIRASAGTVFSVPLARRTDATEVLAWLREQRHPDRRGAGRRRAALHRRRPARPAGARAGRRGGRADRRLDADDIGRRPDCRCSASPTASTSRSAPRSCCTRPAGSAGSRPERRGVTVDRFDFVIIGAGPAGEAAAYKARELGASVAVVDRRLVRRQLPAHRLPAVEVAARRRRAARGEPRDLRLGRRRRPHATT